jgi:alkanesulfonate monooxygenase SsuD/methylene tetrahydromethanopterin reductase-like flavin-dependent oxidoreductase (luciferase family)
MNIGLMLTFRNPPQWRRPFPEFYADHLRQIQLAEKLGYDTVWLSEHHFSEDGYSPSLLPIAGAIAAATERIRIGTYLLLLPLHNAVRVAEDVAVLDALSNGRIDLGIGQGYSRAEFEGYGVPLSERGSRTEEGIQVLKGLWTQESFSFTGKHYQLKNAMLTPRPQQLPHPPLWVGAFGDKAIDRAARLGCHYFGSEFSQAAYDAALVRHGRNPDDYHAGHLRFVHVAPTRDEAWANCQEHLHYMYTWYARWGGDAQATMDAQLPPAAETRLTHLLVGMHPPGIDPAKSRRSMELFAREVMPALR